ncbi:hypothetical protein [uncultured Roseovarius sp.]|uniref:hypothetical protein n=1 Tax=uncultured Roseovarius sp. TaxID=293344 RepID=UPI00262C277A|nr:hypothetical protein [uncultured Roseovarius sp.]
MTTKDKSPADDANQASAAPQTEAVAGRQPPKKVKVSAAAHQMNLETVGGRTGTNGKVLFPFDIQNAESNAGWSVVSNYELDSTPEQAEAMRHTMKVLALLERFYTACKPKDAKLLSYQLRETARGIAQSGNRPNKLADFAIQVGDLEREIALRCLAPMARKQLKSAAVGSLVFFFILSGFWYFAASFPEMIAGSILSTNGALLPLGFNLGLIAIGVLLGRFVVFMSMLRTIVSGEKDYYVVVREIPTGLGPLRDIVVASVLFLILKYKIVSVGFADVTIGTAAASSGVLGSAENAKIFVLGFLVGLVIPLVVDRMLRTSRDLVESSTDVPEPSG